MLKESCFLFGFGNAVDFHFRSRCSLFTFVCPIIIVCRRQKTMQVDATVFTCISMLSRAMGPSIQPDIKELLEPMLAVGLR